jgi:hypothetical protein
MIIFRLRPAKLKAGLSGQFSGSIRTDCLNLAFKWNLDRSLAFGHMTAAVIIFGLWLRAFSFTISTTAAATMAIVRFLRIARDLIPL